MAALYGAAILRSDFELSLLIFLGGTLEWLHAPKRTFRDRS